MHYRIELLLTVLCVLIAFNTHAVSFTADAVQLRGSETSHAKMYWKDGSVRFEYMDRGVPMVQIFDDGNKKMIWLDTEKKVYILRKLTDHQAVLDTSAAVTKYNPCDEFPGAECTHLKTATINDRRIQI